MLGRQHLSNRTFDFFRYVHRIVATVRKKFQIYEKKKSNRYPLTHAAFCVHRCPVCVVETNNNERGFMLEKWLEPQCVSLHNKAASYKDAISIGGDLLISAGKATDSFKDRMISAVEEFGPYMVIAPGIAIPHARPEDGALAVGLSLVTLDTPVNFGNPENDPVNIIVCLCSTDSNSHLDALARLVSLLEEKRNIDSILSASDVSDVMTLISQY